MTGLEQLHEMDERLHVFLDVWREARGSEIVPMRKSFSPVAVPALLSNIYIYRFDAAIGDYVCDLAGEQVNDAYGRSIKGDTLLQIVGVDDHPVITSRWNRILGVPCIHYGMTGERMSRRPLQTAERLLLPFASSPGQRDTIIGVGLYGERRSLPDHPPLMPSAIVQIPCADFS
ncbi:MAG: PAS domain-containing protein [Minwuia sp.]|nr:PAS domain-containing protein [Minwuia sp.]